MWFHRGVYRLIALFHRDEAGATAAEYAIMASAIAGTVAAIVKVLGFQTFNLFNSFYELFLSFLP